jgi:SAM-dependent methyltransferase
MSSSWAAGAKNSRPQFIDFAGVADGEKILDVGCGTGSLTFALARAADLSEITSIDYSRVFVQEAMRRNTDPRIKVRQADACALPFEGGAFDRALALLVLHFVPQARQGSRRNAPRRSVRRRGCGSSVGPSRWRMRMMIDTVAALSEGASRKSPRSHWMD